MNWDRTSVEHWTCQTTASYKRTVWTRRRGGKCKNYRKFDIIELWKSCFDANLNLRLFYKIRKFQPSSFVTTVLKFQHQHFLHEHWCDYSFHQSPSFTLLLIIYYLYMHMYALPKSFYVQHLMKFGHLVSVSKNIFANIWGKERWGFNRFIQIHYHKDEHSRLQYTIGKSSIPQYI